MYFIITWKLMIQSDEITNLHMLQQHNYCGMCKIAVWLDGWTIRTKSV